MLGILDMPRLVADGSLSVDDERPALRVQPSAKVTPVITEG
jgi:hypothetical protein